VVALWRLQQMRRRGLPYPEAQAVAHRLADGSTRRQPAVTLDAAVPAPLTFGVLRPVIVLPATARDWPPETLGRALIHELAHVRRGDWWLHVIGRVTCAIYWFHPLAWSAYRRLALEAERACDDEVPAWGDEASYADQLVALARGMQARDSLLLGMANRSDLAARVAAVLDRSQPRRRLRAAPAAIIAALTVSALVGVAPVRAVVRAAAIDVVEPPAQTAQPARRPSRLDRALVEAADDGDLADVQELLDLGADVNAARHGEARQSPTGGGVPGVIRCPMTTRSPGQVLA
jgi:beta-lactamase regulating signal transducer with metallopeptidase domain